jgi:hypothetical protein
MSEQVENVFDLLDDEDREEREDKEENSSSSGSSTAQDKQRDHGSDNLPIETETGTAISTEEENGVDSSWTDVPSTKTRKVAIPVGSLFKQDSVTVTKGASAAPTASATTTSSTSAASPAATAAQSSADAAQKKKGLILSPLPRHLFFSGSVHSRGATRSSSTNEMSPRDGRPR